MTEKILDYEQTLSELLGLIGQQVTVFAGTHSTPPVTMTLIDGVLERGSDSPLLLAAHANFGTELGDHVMFKVGESGYFPIVRSEFIETIVRPGFRMLQFRDYDLVVMTAAD